eukprot:3161457-Amphidinium_carterae.1
MREDVAECAPVKGLEPTRTQREHMRSCHELVVKNLLDSHSCASRASLYTACPMILLQVARRLVHWSLLLAAGHRILAYLVPDDSSILSICWTVHVPQANLPRLH